VTDNHQRSKWTTIVILAVLFAGGAFHWIWFFNYGHMSFRPYDWGKEFIYYSVLQRAIESGSVPYHIPQAFHGSNRFLALPEVNLSPQIFFLPAVDVGTFVVLNTVLLYAAGFVGTLLIRRRYGLSLLSFTVFFLLFNFNGHIVAHLGVGHSMWGGYFLLPFLFLFLLEVLEGGPWRTGALKIAFALAAILLQGSLHVYIWCLLFLVFVLAFNWKQAKPLALAIAASGVLSAYRLLPALFALWGKKEKFIWSYPTPLELLDALTTIRESTPERLRPWGTAGWWEHDAYIGLLGLAVLVIFGIWMRFAKRDGLEKYRYRELDVPLVLMALLSVSYVHAFITRIPVPLLKSERVAMRFVIIPVVLLALLSSIRMEVVLRSLRQTFKLRFLAISTMALAALSFVDHSYLWSIARLDRIFTSKAVDLTVPPIQDLADGLYKTTFGVSVGISLAALAVSIYAMTKWRRIERQA
jgi:hypothetical protein